MLDVLQLEKAQDVWDDCFAAQTGKWPFLTLAWHKAWFTHLGQSEKPLILYNPASRVLLPLALNGTTAHFSGGEEIADYLDAIGPDEAKTGAWREALPVLASHGATTVLLRNIPEDSPTIQFFRSVTNAKVETEDTTPIIGLSETFDAYLTTLDRKDRHELRRKMRRFEQNFPSVRFALRQRREVAIDDLIRLMRHDPEKTSFLTPEMEAFFRHLPETSENKLLQFILTENSVVIATIAAFPNEKSLLSYNSGYDPAFAGAGWYLKVKSIAWAIENGFTRYNLLQGNERYKYDLGAKDFWVFRVQVNLN